MTELEAMIFRFASPSLTVSQVAELANCDRSNVYRCIERYGLTLKQRKKPEKRSTLPDKILALSDGKTTSAEIAQILGCHPKYVQNVLRQKNAKRLARGAMYGESNPSFVSGRRIDHDGYASVTAPDGHPYARKDGSISEHRLVAEKMLGRYLDLSEVVDHIDGLHLHNAPANLRVFGSNADHLRATITGKIPSWSDQGLHRMNSTHRQRKHQKQVDSYRQRKANGDVRLRQILLAASRFGIDSPFLLGTHRHLEKAQIDYSSPTTIELALADLFPE